MPVGVPDGGVTDQVVDGVLASVQASHWQEKTKTAERNTDAGSREHTEKH